MTRRRSQTRVRHGADQMFDLVADVERYPEFIPHCAALRVVSRRVDDAGRGEMAADMVVAYRMFRETFRSLVRLDRPARRIEARYVTGPLRRLETVWTFADLGPAEGGGSTVGFEIDFEFSNLLLQAAAGAVFEKAFVRMADAFVARADAVYGAPG